MIPLLEVARHCSGTFGNDDKISQMGMVVQEWCSNGLFQ